MQQPIFQFESEPQNTPESPSSHCSSVQEWLATYGSEALDTAEHLGLILGSQKQADALLEHFGSLTVLARASVQELLPFVSPSKALRLVSSLRMGAVALREERQSLTIDSPLAIAELCSEMGFLEPATRSRMPTSGWPRAALDQLQNLKEAVTRLFTSRAAPLRTFIFRFVHWRQLDQLLGVSTVPKSSTVQTGSLAYSSFERSDERAHVFKSDVERSLRH